MNYSASMSHVRNTASSKEGREWLNNIDRLIGSGAKKLLEKTWADKERFNQNLLSMIRQTENPAGEIPLPSKVYSYESPIEYTLCSVPKNSAVSLLTQSDWFMLFTGHSRVNFNDPDVRAVLSISAVETLGLASTDSLDKRTVSLTAEQLQLCDRWLTTRLYWEIMNANQGVDAPASSLQSKVRNSNQTEWLLDQSVFMDPKFDQGLLSELFEQSANDVFWVRVNATLARFCADLYKQEVICAIYKDLVSIKSYIEAGSLERAISEHQKVIPTKSISNRI